MKMPLNRFLIIAIGLALVAGVVLPVTPEKHRFVIIPRSETMDHGGNNEQR